MYVKFGSFQFGDGEAGLGVRMTPNRTPRGFKRTIDVRFDISGESCVSGASNINTRLQEIQAAFSQDFQDIGLFDDSNNPTVHYVPNNSIYNLTGNLVLYQQYPQTIDGEFVSGRKFAIGVGCELLDVGSNIIDYKDSIRFEGNAGPEYAWRRDPFWGWYAELVAPSSIQRVIHEGYAVSMLTHILPPAPYYAPPFEQNTQRVVDFMGPDRYPQRFTDFVTRWRYVYYLPVANDGLRGTVR